MQLRASRAIESANCLADGPFIALCTENLTADAHAARIRQRGIVPLDR